MTVKKRISVLYSQMVRQASQIAFAYGSNFSPPFLHVTERGKVAVKKMFTISTRVFTTGLGQTKPPIKDSAAKDIKKEDLKDFSESSIHDSRNNSQSYSDLDPMEPIESEQKSVREQVEKLVETPFMKKLLFPFLSLYKTSGEMKDSLEEMNTIPSDFSNILGDLEFYHHPSILDNVSKQFESPRHPIVLCHGLFGFDRIGPPFMAIHYWRGIQEQLENMGCQVFVACVPPCATVEERARALHHQLIEQFEPGTSLNLIAHSMGGLDCRYLISRLGFPANHELHIKSLTTICTPHRGTTVVDLIFEKWLEPESLESLLEKTFGIRAGAFHNLSTGYCNSVFNPETPDKPGVLYYSFGASPPNQMAEKNKKFWLLGPLHRRVFEREGPNDGIVSVNSAKWGTYLGTLPSDHLDLRCLSARGFFKAGNLYCQIADHLHQQGC